MRHLILAVALMLLSSAVSAVDMQELSMKKNCTGCHAIKTKIVGPALLDVANRYKENNEAFPFLVAKIKSCGFGVWGWLPMPEQQVTDAEAKELAQFILGLSGTPAMAVSAR